MLINKKKKNEKKNDIHKQYRATLLGQTSYKKDLYLIA